MNKNKKQNVLKKIFSDSESRKQIAIALIMTLLIAIFIIVVGYFMKKDTGTVMAILGVVEMCFGLLWLLFRSGLASTSRYAMRNTASSALNKKSNKKNIEKKYHIKRSSSPYDLEQKESKKKKIGIYLMIAIGITFTLISICILYI
ncbi:DUF3899 domain-containing protein [Mycoplasma marinum]|uniref:DUF3899 domain-containing protein n=1 Tax=Mycoplasma marinum TaxID=1937190 RepID=A0A4R0XSK2_9MOLU|nr:DUF3899 domain-containing protein [Mycoplasma marinum]TCG11861.1 hypothetical protein C4B24_00490 [Mycoplasma marinum]